MRKKLELVDKESAVRALRQRIIEAYYFWKLDIFNDYLKEKNNWKVTGSRDAIYIYLGGKYGWTIEQCRGMTDDALRTILAVELKSWKMPSGVSKLYDPILKLLAERYPP